jgi:hypothetical protein
MHLPLDKRLKTVCGLQNRRIEMVLRCIARALPIVDNLKPTKPVKAEKTWYVQPVYQHGARVFGFKIASCITLAKNSSPAR